MKKLSNKFYILILSIFASVLFTTSCRDKNESYFYINETPELTKIQEVSNSDYTFSLYTKSGNLTTGYNRIYFQVKDKSTGSLILNKDMQLSWKLMMQMPSMSHSCPYSDIAKTSGMQTLYDSFAIFPMASDAEDVWNLTLNYNIGSKSGSVQLNPNVSAANLQNLQNFAGSDGKNYFIALVEPSAPKMGTNDMTAYLYEMQDMNTFVPVDNFTVKIDPRMPAMENHNSPNNIDLTSSNSGLYSGKVNFTMSGYWKINMIVLDSDNQTIAGEEVTDTNPASSLFFELQF
jgi:hypothetical protein